MNPTDEELLHAFYGCDATALDRLALLVVGEDHDRLRSAVDELPPDHRDTVLLCYFEDLSAKEIAEIHNVPLGTVYRRLSEARACLREKLAEPIPSGR